MISQTANRSLRLLRFGIVLCLFSPHRSMAVATISLKAVAKNGVAITPTSTLQIQPGDVITADVFLSGWNNPPFDGGQGLIATYQVRLASVTSALSANACGSCNTEYVLPLGWDGPLETDSCPCNNPCFPVCQFSQCVGPSLNQSQMAQINTTRTDWIFHGFADISAVDVSTVNVRWGSTLFEDGGQTASRCSGGSLDGFSCSSPVDCPGGFCDPNYRSYLGTLNLKAGAAVCGTYTISFDGNETFISNDAAPHVTMYPGTQGLTLITGLPCTETWGACCTDNGNYMLCGRVCEADCIAANQSFGGVGSTCDIFNPPCLLPGGACCLEDIGYCTDGVIEAQCGGYWGGPDSTCATWDPPCVPPVPSVGACCVDSGCGGRTCRDDVRELNCAGDWGGAQSTCDTIDPPCAPDMPCPVYLPANCAIDARRPFPSNQPSVRDGFTSWSWSFQHALTSSEDSPDDFTVRQSPSTPPMPPTISSVTLDQPNNSLTLHFSAPIQPDRWTCVQHNASGLEKCLGFLPGDVDANRTVNVVDIIKIIDNLNGLVISPLTMYQCDIDRSGLCRPADILTEIDLLNGNGFPSQYGKTLEPCPSR